MNQEKKGCLVKFKTITFWLIIIFGILLAGLYITNIRFPESSPHVDRLSQIELIRAHEIDHLRSSVGNQIWPGFGDQQIPIVLYNEAYVFLVGLQDPETGWKKVPFTKQMGRSWTYFASSTPYTYYRQPIISSEQIPEAFTVQIGDHYAASMTTKTWTGIKLTKLIETELPAFLKPIFPYSLVRNKFNSDWHISAVIHEAFHAFQAKKVLERVRSAEASNTFENSYPWKNPDFRETWQKERFILGTILKTTNEKKFIELTQEWLLLREQRRKTFDDPKLANYEQEREWLEGLGKYAEVRSWILASDKDTYEPIEEMSSDPDFDHYNNGLNNRKNEIKQLQSDLNFSESIFYYTGWAQAEILDRLMPDWKEKAFEPNIYLDDLIRNAIDPSSYSDAD